MRVPTLPARLAPCGAGTPHPGRGRMDQDDGTTGRQDDEKSSPAAFGTSGTNSRQPVGSSSCRPFSEPARGVLRHSGQDCRIGRMNRMGGMGSVNPDHPGILSKRCRAAGRRPENRKGGALAEPSDSSEFHGRRGKGTPMSGSPPLTLLVFEVLPVLPVPVANGQWTTIPTGNWKLGIGNNITLATIHPRLAETARPTGAGRATPFRTWRTLRENSTRRRSNGAGGAAARYFWP